jgi:DNA-binding transcriptional LysR family regulator
MRNVTLRQLQSMTAIEETGKISSAANKLGLTGPAVTLQLKQLETELGISLFDRTPDGLRPTVAGKAALECAHAVLERLRILENDIEQIKDVRKGSLRLGVVSTAKYFAPRLIAVFKKHYPDIMIELFVGNRHETIDALANHAVDIALMGRPPREISVRSMVFGDHPLVIVAPSDHRLAHKMDITKEEIAREHFIIREPGSGTRTSLEIFFSDIPEKMEDLGTEMGSNETIKQAVMAGLGVAFISAHTIEQELQLKRLVILDVLGMPIRRQWFTVSRSDRSLSPAMAAFNDFLRNEGIRHLPIIPNVYPASSIAAHDLK